jgi:hypothetical protein
MSAPFAFCVYMCVDVFHFGIYNKQIMEIIFHKFVRLQNCCFFFWSWEFTHDCPPSRRFVVYAPRTIARLDSIRRSLEFRDFFRSLIVGPRLDPGPNRKRTATKQKIKAHRARETNKKKMNNVKAITSRNLWLWSLP